MSDRAAPHAAWLMRLASDALRALIGAGADRASAWWVPGRIEVLGKHTDYAGGRSLLCAAERGFCVRAVPRDDAVLRIVDARLGETVELPIDASAPPHAGWPRYPAVVARRLARDFGPALRGADLALAGDLPMAAGLSGSSALVVATVLALADVNDLRAHAHWPVAFADDDALCGYLGAIENGAAFGDFAADGGVGTHGGSEDHTAILRGRADSLVRYAFHPVRFEREVALPAGVTFVVAASGVAAEKALAARERYNAIAAKAHAIVRRWRAATGRDEDTLAAIAHIDANGARVRDVLRESRDADFEPRQLLARFEQFLLEHATLVPAATDALATRDLGAFGELAARSHDAAVRLLGNQVPETMTLTELARTLGAHASSAFGAGFGGSVWALVNESEAERFAESWRARYLEQYPEREALAEFFVTRAGPPAMKLP